MRVVPKRGEQDIKIKNSALLPRRAGRRCWGGTNGDAGRIGLAGPKLPVQKVAVRLWAVTGTFVRQVPWADPQIHLPRDPGSEGQEKVTGDAAVITLHRNFKWLCC